MGKVNEFAGVAVSSSNDKGISVYIKNSKAAQIMGVNKNSDNTVDLLSLNNKMKLIFFGSDEIKIVDELPKIKYDSMIIFSNKDLDKNRVNAIASSIGEKIQNLGENWIVAASTLSNYKNWFVLFGLPASFAFSCL